jgi:hypothetical protein
MTSEGKRIATSESSRRSGSMDPSLVVLVSAMTVSIVPFIKSIATKAGEDAYESVKRLLNKNVKPGERGHIRILKLDDPSRNVQVHLSNTLSKDGATQFYELDLEDPRIHDGDILCYGTWQFLGQHYHLSWDAERRNWVDRATGDLDAVRNTLLSQIYDKGRITRVSVNLSAQSAEILTRLRNNNGISLSEAVGRAIRIYGFIDEQSRSNKKLLIEDIETGEIRRVEFL